MKRALVLSGGGVKGSYQVGSIKKLAQMGLNFDIICGSSVGAINSSFLAQYKKEEFMTGARDLELFWNCLEQKQIYKNWLPFFKISALWKKSFYNSEPLMKLMERVIDAEKLKNSGIELRIGTVSVNTGNYKIYDQNFNLIKKSIVASASFPPFLYPIKVNDEYEYDAGLREYTPIKSAIDAGANEIYIVCTEIENLPLIKNPNKLKTFSILKRFIYTLSSEVIHNDFKNLTKINKKVKEGLILDKKIINSFLISPKTELVEDSLNFNQEIITKLIKTGYNDTEELFKNESFRK